MDYQIKGFRHMETLRKKSFYVNEDVFYNPEKVSKDDIAAIVIDLKDFKVRYYKECDESFLENEKVKENIGQLEECASMLKQINILNDNIEKMNDEVDKLKSMLKGENSEDELPDVEW